MFRKPLAVLLGLVALLITSGTARAQAKVIPFTSTQLYSFVPYGGTTWTEGGITHVRDLTIPALNFYDSPPRVTLVFISVNENLHADGSGVGWGTSVEYEYDPANGLFGTPGPYGALVSSGTFTSKVWVPVSGVYGEVQFLGHDADGSKFKGTIILHTAPDPIFHAVQWGEIEGSVLVQPGK